MKIKVSEATQLQLNLLVATCEGWKDYNEDGLPYVQVDSSHMRSRHAPYQPSSNWEHGGPILERVGITLRVNARVLDHWAAFIDFGGSSCNIKARHTGPTPLIAAMRCYVASKLGDEVDVPEELA